MKIGDLVFDFLPAFAGIRHEHPGIIIDLCHMSVRILWNDNTMSWREIKHLELLSEHN
jgi:hypothetical protein